ncbi:MAG TPA: methylmalonyl-CoA mutase family protein, partial [Candidatus Sabulitectum sp.]|nr:methylmalonyl-CoA mutase family protein [Candidatus Sabulitectum sp.]
DIAKRKSVWVGVNMYANTSEERLEAKPVDREQLLKRRVNAVSEFRASRSEHSLPPSANSLNELMEAADSGATLQDLYGLTSGRAEKPDTATPVKRQRGAERFENLREETLKMAKSGMHTSVLLLNMGSLPNHKPRADFTRGFFEVGGFNILSGKGSGTIEELVDAALDTSARIAVFCGSDNDYPEMVPGAAERIRKERPDLKLVLAGRPAEDMEPVYTKAGIDHYIYLGSNCYDLLKTLQEGIKSNG